MHGSPNRAWSWFTLLNLSSTRADRSSSRTARLDHRLLSRWRRQPGQALRTASRAEQEKKKKEKKKKKSIRQRRMALSVISSNLPRWKCREHRGKVLGRP